MNSIDHCAVWLKYQSAVHGGVWERLRDQPEQFEETVNDTA
ncbi:hypothetical protein SAMN05877838_1271 [Hoeflea halophila]|uniref:Uncharacterized protein n=1 Tax=Hoeflea halophila TaxID=714899 RepID=A0A286IAQ5_9HYPH|nr:hypothetical protein SAMN05877838_1271 [Hoeflea halophila]